MLCLHLVIIAQGLGPKYGQPKLKLTACVRDQFTISARQAQIIDDLLAGVQRQLDQAKPDQGYVAELTCIWEWYCKPTAYEHIGYRPMSLSTAEQVVGLLAQLRPALIARAKFLQCLSSADVVGKLKIAPLAAGTIFIDVTALAR